MPGRTYYIDYRPFDYGHYEGKNNYKVTFTSPQSESKTAIY